MDPAEVEFLAEKETVKIVPNFSLDKVYLIGVSKWSQLHLSGLLFIYFFFLFFLYTVNFLQNIDTSHNVSHISSVVKGAMCSFGVEIQTQYLNIYNIN